ncbi:MAG: family 10 glycosylhydrolase [Clostridia bacterium]|nr:family 10 glycosylhydrolase [Clostridia bacterium]
MKDAYTALAQKDKLLAKRVQLEKGANSSYKPLNYDKMKAIWISQFDFKAVYTDGNKQRSQKSYKELLGKALDNIQALGFNTVIVQLRPNADSFYPSEYYPWSHFINGSYGKFAKYDPIKIFIDEAHKRKLSFQAWINPMRCMTLENAEKLDDAYPMVQWMKDPNRQRYLFVGDYVDKKAYYLNVYYEEVRQLIINGAAEIVRYYKVDGVHMDDYFYPGNDEAMDDVEFAAEKAKNPEYTLKEMRYESLSKLVSGIYSAVKAENPNVLYGIAPAGNLNNVRKFYYADVDTWCSTPGYIDYIMPQIYWGFDHPICPFAETYQLWAALCCDSVKFMAGLTFANAVYGYDGSHYDEFKDSKDVYRKTFEYINAQSSFEGFAVFCYQYYFNALTNMANVKTAEEIVNAFTAMAKIPSKKIKY